MSSSEVACTLAALILHDDGIPITVRYYTFTPILILLFLAWGGFGV
jgi:hypothetical protein